MVKERFEGSAGRRLLIEALKTQKMVAGNTALAEELADLVTVMAVKTGEKIIIQGDSDNDIFFILTGSFSIIVNGRRVIAQRHINDHVGEMSAVEPSHARVATVMANEDSIVCKLPESHLVDLGQRYPDIWRYFARELARRLTQRNSLLDPLRERIQVFIMSSTEALHIARAIQSNFVNDSFSVVLWSDGVFTASSYAMEILEKAVDASDFGIVIAQPDDLINIRGVARSVPRDNVIFEVGFFMGRLGRKRTLLLEPLSDKVKLPTDLSGLMTIGYQYGKLEDLPTLLSSTCDQMRKIINDLGSRY
jgi:CRP/FNR family transcriptional regulator, cyclic AMP receptor protein